MDNNKKTIGYKGHRISREPHHENAYIHWKYTVTGPLFQEPYETFNMAEAKNEISSRARKDPEWYQHYLNYKRFNRTNVVHSNCGSSTLKFKLEHETWADESALLMKKIRHTRVKITKFLQNEE